jgi:Domain of unknown function (DUF4189)
MKFGVILAAGGIAAFLMPQQASAYGALAVGVPPDVGKSGFAYGINVASPTQDRARESALADCRGTNAAAEVHSQSSNPAQKLCKVVMTFRHQCAVVAEDPAAGTPGVGWAVAPTLEDATRQALNNCMATAGKDRRQFCARDAYQCDTK